MAKRGVEQPAFYVARNVADNEPATGDAANHTIAWVKDGVATAATNTPVEVSAALAPGLYYVTITTAEADCALGVLAGTSSTEDVELFGVAMSFDDPADIVAALYASTATLGGATFAQFCDFLTAMAKGKFEAVAENTYAFYADDSEQVLYTLQATPTGRRLM